MYRARYRGQLVAAKVMRCDDSGAKPLKAMVGATESQDPGRRHVIKMLECTMQRQGDVTEAWLLMELCSQGSLQRWIDKGYLRD